MGGGLSSYYVDLGLQSGLLWGVRNIGAATPEDAGLFFQWGDVQGYTAEQVGNGEGQKYFHWSDYKFSIDGSSSNFSKYNYADNKVVLDLEDDAAHVLMGGNWRMPTQEDFHELINNTDLYLVPVEGAEIKGNVITEGAPSWASIYMEWEQQPTGNIKGLRFYKKNDHSVYMFVPAAGNAGGGSINYVGEHGNLWSSSINSKNVQYARHFLSNADYCGASYCARFSGLPLRGVLTQ